MKHIYVAFTLDVEDDKATFVNNAVQGGLEALVRGWLNDNIQTFRNLDTMVLNAPKRRMRNAR